MIQRTWNIDKTCDVCVVQLSGTSAEQKVPRAQLGFEMKRHGATTEQVERLCREVDELGRTSVRILTVPPRIVQIWP